MQLQQWKYGQTDTVLHTSKQEQVKPTISQAPGQTALPRGPLCANFEKPVIFCISEHFWGFPRRADVSTCSGPCAWCGRGSKREICEDTMLQKASSAAVLGVSHTSLEICVSRNPDDWMSTTLCSRDRCVVRLRPCRYPSHDGLCSLTVGPRLLKTIAFWVPCETGEGKGSGCTCWKEEGKRGLLRDGGRCEGLLEHVGGQLSNANIDGHGCGCFDGGCVHI